MIEAGVGHRKPGTVIEIIQIEAKRPVGLEVDEMLEDQRRVLRLAIGSETHDLVLARIHLEAGVVGKRRVEQPQGVRKVDLATHFQRVCVAVGKRRRRPLSHAVHREHHRLVERRREIRARRVAEVVLGEEQPLLDILTRAACAKLLREQILEEELLAQPHRDRHAEGLEAARSKREVGLQQSLELEEGLVVEGDVVDVVE